MRGIMARTDARLADAARLLLATAPNGSSQPVKWYTLLLEMEEHSRTTGDGLSLTWGYVHREQYGDARESFEEVRQLYKRASEHQGD
jgi:hypothetical protein